MVKEGEPTDGTTSFGPVPLTRSTGPHQTNGGDGLTLQQMIFFFVSA
jgi:hypothetical protein